VSFLTSPCPLLKKEGVRRAVVNKKSLPVSGKALSLLLVQFYSDCADPSRFNSSTRRPLIRITLRTRVCKLFFISFLF
jgi:hypothetical protein